MIFTPTSFFQEPQVASIGQDPLYNYYYLQSFNDVSIPLWTVRVLKTLVGNMGGQAGTGIGSACFSCNAQYATASFGGLQANPNISTRVTNGAVRAYGLGAFFHSFSSESLFVDTWDTLSTSTPCSQLFSTIYGGTFAAASKGFVNRDYTRYVAGTTNVWGNQPYTSSCATYNPNGANLHYLLTCQEPPTIISGSSNVIECAREYQQLAGTPIITNYFTASCGTL